MSTPKKSESFTIAGKTFTEGGEMMLRGVRTERRVEVIGRSVDDDFVAVRLPNRRIRRSHHSELQPLFEPTIEVPVGVAKAVAGAARTADEITTAAETLRRLIEKAGH